MKTTRLPEQPDAKSPAGADIRYLMDGKTGNMIHSTVPPHQINAATVHATVSEFWYVLEGHGQVWRDDGEESNVTDLVPGTAVDIPVGTSFQYRNISDTELKFICIEICARGFPGLDLEFAAGDVLVQRNIELLDQVRAVALDKPGHIFAEVLT